MFVCVARLTLEIPDSGSLKAKRQILRRVTDRVKARFNVSVAEVDENDVWNRAVIALAVVGNDRRFVDEMMGKIIHFVDEMYVAPLIARETEIISFGDQLAGSDDRPFTIPTGQRSLAEAEGMPDWETRHEQKLPAPPSSGKGKLSLDEARAKARALRNPREWEKK
jgi:uncharacterized protein